MRTGFLVLSFPHHNPDTDTKLTHAESCGLATNESSFPPEAYSPFGSTVFIGTAVQRGKR